MLYGYDDLARLETVVRDSVEVDRRYYDRAGRLVQSGGETITQDYAAALNAINTQAPVLGGNGSEVVKTQYFNGRMVAQGGFQATANNGLQTKYTAWYLTGPTGNQHLDADAAGNTLDYLLDVVGGNGQTQYAYEYKAADGYLQTKVQATNSGVTGTTTTTYDANGHTRTIDDSQQDANDRIVKTDAQGRILYIKQNGHVQRQLIVNGEVMGRYGDVVNDAVPREEGVPSFKDIADFGFGFTPMGGTTPKLQESAHTVSAGDTMQSIAQAYYGDSRLWYKVAQANGIASNGELHAGQVLKIPGTEVAGNAANTFKPYNPAEVIGDTSPYVPMPKKSGNWLKQLIVMVVVMIVAFVTQQYYLIQQGTAAVTAVGEVSASALGDSLLADIGAAAGGSTAGGAIGGAVGSLAGQAVGNALGTQSGFSFKQVAMSAISGGVGGALNGVDFTGSGYAQTAGNQLMRAAVGNAVTQGIGVATGLQRSFDWRSVAASAVGAGVGQAVGSQMPNNFGGRLATGLLSGAATAVARGGKIAVQQIAVDAFGQSLAQSIAETANSAPVTQGVPQPGELGSGTFNVPGVDDVFAPTMFGGGRPMGPIRNADDVLRLNDDTRVISDWDPSGLQAYADNARLLLGGGQLAGQGLGYRAPQKPAFVPGDGAAGQAFLDNVSEVMRETRGMGPTRASMYRDFAVSGKFGQLDQSGQAVALAGMVSYADAMNQTLIAESLEGRTADVAVRYAADAAKASGAIPETFRFGSDARVGALAGLTMLNSPVRRQQEVPLATNKESLPPKNPTAYSVLFETKLQPADFGRSRTVHENRANATVDSVLKADAEFAALLEANVPGLAQSVSKVGGRETPAGWTWEHASTSTAFGQPGVMRLVPEVQHTPGSAWWRVLHPNPGAAGGYSEWAIPAGAPKNR